MSVARKKVLPMVLPTPPATTPTAVTPAPSLTATPTLHATTVPQVATAPVSTTTTNLPIQPAPPQLVPIKPLPQPIPAQLITQKIQPAPMLQTMPKPIQPNTATTSTSTHTLQSTFQTVQTMNFQVNGGAPQTIAPSQLLPSPALGAQTPQTQKQLRGAQKSKTQQAQTTAQKPRKQKQTKRAVKRTPPITTTAQPILPRPAKGRTKITAEEIQLVQSLIERCLQLYMNQTEVITALHLQANIEPSFTSLVWLKLEEQNPDFFKAYHVRLRIKEQITAFNYLVSQQAQLMQKAGTFSILPAGLNQGNNAGTQMGLQTTGSPLIGSPPNMTYGLQQYAPLPQLPSLQALASQTAASGLTTSHPPPIAPRVPQANARNPTLSPQQTNGLLTPTATPFVAPMAENMTYNFTSTTTHTPEELKDDTPITEDIDTNQFFLSES